MTELQAITGQLYIVEGNAQPVTAVPGILAQAAPTKVARTRERDFLFIHLTLSGQSEESTEMANRIVQQISHDYYNARGTVTSSLRRAIINANEWMLRRNLNNRTKRYGAITCAALRQGELFMVQAGEALAFLGHNFGVERIPARTPERITPLGQSAGLEMRYYHHRLNDGDMLLLAEPRMAHLPTTAFTNALVNSEVEEGLPALMSLIGNDTARLLLVEFTTDVPAGLPDVSHVTTQSAPTAEPEPVPVPRRETAVSPSAPSLPKPSVDFTAVEHSARQAAATSVMGLSRFTAWLAAFLEQIRPTPEEDETSWTIPLLLAIFIPILMAVIVTGVYLERGRTRRFSEIKVEMGQNLALAEEAGDNEELARNHYYSVLALANEAAELNPTDREVLRLRQEATAALDRLDGITRLVARPYYTYPDGTQLTAVTLRDTLEGGIFTLDSTNNALYFHETDNTYMVLASPNPQQLAFEGMAVGDKVVTNLVDMFWQPAGQNVTEDRLLALDGSGLAFAYMPESAQMDAAPLGLASEWLLPVAVTTYDERLYVLDNGASLIWKYFPEGNQFATTDDRTIVLDGQTDFDQAADFDIYTGDASMVVVYRDGRIRYYNTFTGEIMWDEKTLLANGLNAPFASPSRVSFVGSGLNATIYVADPGTSRIVQISRVGTVLAQYRAAGENGQELFEGITDFAVPENLLDATFRLFVVKGNVVYMATLE
jgi:hypothetical protein